MQATMNEQYLERRNRNRDSNVSLLTLIVIVAVQLGAIGVAISVASNDYGALTTRQEETANQVARLVTSTDILSRSVETLRVDLERTSTILGERTSRAERRSSNVEAESRAGIQKNSARIDQNSIAIASAPPAKKPKSLLSIIGVK